MARYKARWGETVYLGDEVRRWSARPVRLTRADRPLLWSTKADAADDSANFVWRIAVVAAIKADSPAALADLVEALAAGMMDDGLTTLTIRTYTTGEPVRTYPACRFDGIEPGPAPPGSPGNLDDELTFTFTSASDPE